MLQKLIPQPTDPSTAIKAEDTGLSSPFLQDLPDSFYMVRAHIVHHDHIFGLKSRKQASFKYWAKRSLVVLPWYVANTFCFSSLP